MAAVEPSYHGGDGGADPPRRPTRVPQRCESGIIHYILNFSFSLLWICGPCPA